MTFTPKYGQTYWCRLGINAYSFKWVGDHADLEHLKSHNVFQTKRHVLSYIAMNFGGQA